MKQFKKCLLPIIAVLVTMNAIGQNTPQLKSLVATDKKSQSENTYRTVNDLKTGNWQSVLSSFLQLSLSDITGDNKAVNFKANLFALKVKADSNLLLSENYVKQQFARNFQFDFSLKVDTQYRFKGFQTGFTWAIINKRDSTVVNFANTALAGYYKAIQIDLLKAFNGYRTSLLDSTGDIPDDKVQVIKEVKAKIDKLLEQDYFIAKERYPQEIIPYLDESYEASFDAANIQFAQEMEKLRMRSLLTLSAKSTFENKVKAFNNGTVDLVYLKGIKTHTTKTELDIRSSFNTRDTIVITTDRRTSINTSAGINFALLESKSGKSIIEFKPYVEYDVLLSKAYTTEKKDNFMANAALRFRILDNFWIPFTLNMILDKGKFLGFLNVEFNFDAFKK